MANMEKYSYKRPERVGTQLSRCGSSRGQYITVLHSTVQYGIVYSTVQYITCRGVATFSALGGTSNDIWGAYDSK